MLLSDLLHREMKSGSYHIWLYSTLPKSIKQIMPFARL